MAYTNNVSVRICGKTMVLSGNESVEYITKVANYIEQKAEDLRKSDNSRSLNANLISVLTSINIADDFFKERDKVTALTKELETLKEKGVPEREETAIEIQGIDGFTDEEKTALEGEINRLLGELDEALINNAALTEELTLLKEEKQNLLLEKEQLLLKEQQLLLDKEGLTLEKETLLQEKEALAQKAAALEADLKEQIAKFNHMKSNQGKKNFKHNQGFRQKPFENNGENGNQDGQGQALQNDSSISGLHNFGGGADVPAQSFKENTPTVNRENEPVEVQEAIRTPHGQKQNGPIKNYYRNT